MEKYTQLLQPIRDLAANWEVDVATELEDYLEQVLTDATLPYLKLVQNCLCLTLL